MATGFRVANIQSLNPSDKFLSTMKFRFSIEIYHDVPSIAWKVIYVSNPESTSYDQILDKLELPEISNQTYPNQLCFDIECNYPQWQHLQKFDILGTNAIIFEATINDQEVYRCGFYVFNGYADEALFQSEQQDMTNMTPIRIDLVYRNIKTEQPRIKTQFDNTVTVQERIQQSQELKQSLLDLEKIKSMQMNVNYNDPNFLSFLGNTNQNPLTNAFANTGQFFSQLDMQNQQNFQFQFNNESQSQQIFQQQQSQQQFQQQQQPLQQFQNTQAVIGGQQIQQTQQQQQQTQQFQLPQQNMNMNVNTNNMNQLERRQESHQLFNNLNNFQGQNTQQCNNIYTF